MRIQLKCWPASFDAIARGEKTAEIRSRDDRDFQVGDILELCKFDPFTQQMMGGVAAVRVTHMDTMAGSVTLMGVRLNSAKEPGTLVGVVVLSFQLLYLAE